jgi:hypothetical protein
VSPQASLLGQMVQEREQNMMMSRPMTQFPSHPFFTTFQRKEIVLSSSGDATTLPPFFIFLEKVGEKKSASSNGK